MVAGNVVVPPNNFADPRVYAYTHNDRGLPEGIVVTGAAPVLLATIRPRYSTSLFGGGGITMRIDCTVVAQNQAVAAEQFAGRRSAIANIREGDPLTIVQEAAVYQDPGATGWTMAIVDNGDGFPALEFTGAAADSEKVMGIMVALILTRAGIPA